MMSFQLKLLVFIAFVLLSWGLIPGKPLTCLPSLHRKCSIPALDQSPQKQPRPRVNLLATAQSSISDETSRPQPLHQVSPMLKINSLMLFFFATLGSTMPYMPLYYRKIGISGKSNWFTHNLIMRSYDITLSTMHNRLTNWYSECDHTRCHLRRISVVGSPR